MSNKYAIRFLALLLLIVAWVYWLPLVVAVFAGTLTDDGIETKARSINASIGQELDNRAKLIKTKQSIETEIAEATPEQIISLLDTYTAVSNYDQQYEKSVRITKYANSLARHYFFASYLALTILVVSIFQQLRDRKKNQLVHFHALRYGLLLYIFLNWSNWWRNTPFGQFDRALYSYAHFDISVAGFAMQELQLIGMMFLCGYILFFALKSTDIQSTMQNPSVSDLSKNAKIEFERWQVHSVLLAVAFLPWTIFYWHIVTAIGETRYFPSAISIHVIWAFIWVVSSIPAWRAFQKWQEFVVNMSVDHSLEEMQKIQLIEPVSKGMFAISAGASTLSFVFPILQGLVAT